MILLDGKDLSSKIKLLFAAILATQVLTSCKDMSRFRFERYICGDNRSKINEIIIRSARLRAKVQINMNSVELIGKIEESSEEWLTISAENLKIEVNRKTGLIKVNSKLNSVFTYCEKSVFTF